MKRIISLILVFIMIFTTNAQYVFADRGQLDPDEEAVIEYGEWLTADIIFGEGNYEGTGEEGYYNTSYTLNLPERGINNIVIEWSFSGLAVTRIEYINTIIRPSYDEGEKILILTAIIKKGEAEIEKIFNIRVSSLEAISDQDAVRADHNRLDEKVIHYGVYAVDIRDNVNLPTRLINGSYIDWTSSDERWIATDGTVTQPPFSFAMGGAPVTLTAHIYSGSESKTKTFDLEVIALEPTDEEKVSIDKDWLIYGIILNGNDADNVRTRLDLPIKTESIWTKSGYYGGCDIEWQSSNQDVITNDGNVIRPNKNEENQEVSLTATISKNNASDTKVFNFLVTSTEEFPLAINYSDFSDTSRLKFNGNSRPKGTALSFDNEVGGGGSIFTKNKIRLGEDLSFSAAFSYRNPHLDFTTGEGGFVFTLQSLSDSVFPESLNDETIKPSLNIGFITDYYKGSGGGQASSYNYTENVTVYYNGDYSNRTAAKVLINKATNSPPSHNNVWIEYDGSSKVLEICFSTDGLRPFESNYKSNYKIEDLELGDILASGGDGLNIEDVGDVYVGFMGSLGDAKDKSEIHSLYFKNDSTPIDHGPYNFTDMSNINISADPEAGQASSTITVEVIDDDGPVEGVPISFYTSLGSLNPDFTITDHEGKATTQLSSTASGTAIVKAIAPGGAMDEIQVQLSVSDEDSLDFDYNWLTEKIILGDNSELNNIISNLNLPKKGLSGSTINWGSSNPSLVDSNGIVTRPSVEQMNQVSLTATISMGEEKPKDKIFNIILKVPDNSLAEADEVWLTNELILNGNESLNDIITNLNLPTTGKYGSAISWSSTNKEIVYPNGRVKAPTLIQGDQSVTLTARIKMGEVILEKKFTVLVKPKPLTDEEAVTLDSNRVKIGDTLGLNPSAYAVTENLSFSTQSSYDSAISYESNVTNNFFRLQNNVDGSITGLVTQPGIEDSHQPVEITVTIGKGGKEKVKTFEYTVLAERDNQAPRLESTSPENGSMDVAYNSKVVLTFDEDIMASDGSKQYEYNAQYFNIKLNGAPIPDWYRITFKGKEMILRSYTGTMHVGKNEFSIPAGTISDKYGNCLEEELNISFTVEERVVKNISIASSIADGTSMVSPDSEISFTFDTSGLVKGSNFYDINLTDDQFLDIPINCTLNDNKVTVSIKHGNKGLQSGKIYMLFIPGCVVRDRFRNQNKMQLLSFVVAAETEKPTIISTFPKKNEENVSVSQQIQINYKDAIFPSGGQISITDQTGKVVEFVLGELQTFDTIVDLIPLKTLQPNTRYTVKISPDFVKTQSVHEPMDSNYEFSFTTGDDKLSIQSMNPLNSAKDVSLDKVISLVFNHPVKYGPNSNLLGMVDSAGKVVGVSANFDGNIAEIRPASKWFDPNKTYTLTMPAGVFKDNEGNLSASLVLSFITGNKLDLSNSDSFSIEPSSRYYVNKTITFDTKRLEERFRRMGRKLVSYEWDFGDQQKASGSQVDHVYTSATEYNVKLKVKDDKGLEYELIQPMDVRSLERYNMEMIVTPDKIQNLIREDEYIDTLDGLPGRQLYKVYIKNEGVYLPEEKVNVYLYKNGKKIKDMATITTKVPINGEVPVGSFLFNYRDTSYLGNYELFFEYVGEMATVYDDIIKRTLKITDQRKKQDLWIKPVNSLSGKFEDIFQFPYFEVDGIKHRGDRKWDEDTLSYYHVIKNLPTGFHKIKLLEDERVVHFSEVVDFWHSSTEEIVILPVKTHIPGISRIWAELNTSSGMNKISSNMKDYKTFFYIPGSPSVPPINFNIDVNWGDGEPGYFEMQYNGWSPERFYDPWFDFQPLELFPGEKLLVRAVNKGGGASPWVDCKITLADPPTNPYVYLTYVDGEYVAETDMYLGDSESSQISGINDMPLMDHYGESFGIDSHYDVAYGKIKESNGRLLLDMSYNIGGSLGGSKKKPKMVSVGYDIEAEQEGRVYLIYDPAVGNWKMEAGEFRVWGDVSVYREKGKVIPIIDLGAKGRITIGTGLGGSVYIDDSPDAPSKYSGIIIVKPYVKGEVYGGLKGFNVEGYVGGSVEAQLHVPTGYIQVIPELNARITNTIFFIKEDVFNETFSTQWNNDKDPVIPPRRFGMDAFAPDSNSEEASYQVIPRNYILQDTETMAKSFYRFDSDAGTTVKNDIYPYSDVQLVRKGNELVAVWVDDNQERSDLNRTQLFSSTSSSWAEIKSLYDDGSADFSPTVTVSGDEVLISWQDFSETISEDDLVDNSLEDLFKKSEISVSGKLADQNDEKDFATLTKDDYYNHSPVIASTSTQSVMTVWISSDDHKLPQGGAGNNRLMYSIRKESIWSQADTLQENMPLISESSLIAGDDSYLLLYTLNSDNNVKTPEDNEVWGRIFNLLTNTWEAPVPLTENNVPDSNPRGVYHKGDWFIIWSQDEGYVYRHGLTGETLTTESLTGISGKTVLTQGDNFLALVYQKGEENNNRNISALFYDLEKEIWSNEIHLISQGGYVRSFSSAFDSDGNLGILYTHADVITEVRDETEYYLPSDRVDLMFSTYSFEHDLAMDEKAGIVLSTENPIPEMAVAVTCFVENKGDFAEMVKVTLYDGISEDGIKIGEVIVEEAIPARSSLPVSMEWIVPAEEKTEYNFYAVVESAEMITEINMDNNHAYLEVYTSDVELTDVKWESLAGYDYLVKPLIFNNGSSKLENIKVVLEYDQNQVAYTEIKELDPGEFANPNFVVSSEAFEKTSTGGYPMTIRLSLSEEIIENSRENNVLEFELDTNIILLDAMNPSHGQEKVGVNESIELIFNRLIEEKTGVSGIKLTDRYLNLVPVTKTIEDNILTIRPKSSLLNSIQYTLDIPEDAIGDSYGFSMRNSQSLSFTTVSQNPVVIRSFPFDQSVNVGMDSEIRIQYSEVIKEGSRFNDIYLVQDANNLKIPIMVTIDEEWLYVNPVSDMKKDTKYSLIIPRGAVKNDSELMQQEDYVLEFTTTGADQPSNGGGHGNWEDTDKEDGSSGVTFDIDDQMLQKLGHEETFVTTLDLTSRVKNDKKILANIDLSVLKQLMERKPSLNIVTGRGDIYIPAELIESFIKKGESPITIAIEQKDVIDKGIVSTSIFDFSITAGGKIVRDFNPKIRVTMPLDMSKVKNGKRVIVRVYDEVNSTWIPVGGVADSSAGTIVFSTGHFSSYAAFEAEKSFADLTSSWAKEKVETLASRGLINGTTETTFDPEASITRAEFTALMIRSLYGSLSKDKGRFTDVAEDSWYADSVETAYDLGLIHGTGIEEFQPDAKISREQMAVILFRLYKYKKGNKDIDYVGKTFLDSKNISSYAEEAIKFVSDTDIMVGSGSQFKPKNNASRQEAAVVLYRLLECVEEL